MSTESGGQTELAMHELREIAGYATKCASKVLPLFERDTSGDYRPRDAIEAATTFATRVEGA